jgi:hypothetical protein
MSEHFLRYCLNEVPWKQTITKLRNIWKCYKPQMLDNRSRYIAAGMAQSV